jgi:uncharacterized protein (TIGR03437 family)
MKLRQGRPVFGIAIFIALAAAFPLWSQHAQDTKSQTNSTGAGLKRRQIINQDTPDDSPADAYVMMRSPDGAACRQMTAREFRQMGLGKRGVSVRAVSDPNLKRSEQQQTGLKIVLRGTQQLEQFPDAKQAFIRAAAKWQSLIKDSITVIIDVDFGTQRFGEPYGSPNIIGSTDPQFLIDDDNTYIPLRANLVSKAADPLQLAVYNKLPAGSIPTNLGPSTSFSASSAQFRMLGELPPVADPDAEADFGIGDPPSIGFNSAIGFDFDPSNGIDADKIDFEASALHEIGHALGFDSQVGINELAPTFPLSPSLWDLFRFTPGGLSLNSITGQSRLQLTGDSPTANSQIYFAGDSELGLSTGGPSGSGGDGRQASHWKDDVITGQYIGIMDPTASNGQREALTAADVQTTLLFGYSINPDTQVLELLSVDDFSREESLNTPNALFVNRFTPSRYPSTLNSVQVRFPATGDFVGQPLRIVAFVDANRTGQPPANPTFIADQTLNVPALPNSRQLEIPFQTPPTIASGDLYIGVQSSSATVAFAGDSSGKQARASFISTNNGASFQPLQNATNAPVNLMAHAMLTNRFGQTPTPAALALSPSALPPGGADFTIVVQGSGFRPNSVVRWNGADRTTTFFSGVELRAQIPAADVASAGTSKVTVFTQGGGESAALNFGVTGDNPAPTLARISPAAVAAGSPATPLNVFGANFTPQSVIRLNGVDLVTARSNSLQLTTQIPMTELAAAGDKKISVFTPGPGGGTTSELTLSVVTCSYTLSAQSLTYSSYGTSDGVNLVTNGACSWSITTDQPWITLTNPTNASGSGKYVISYSLVANSAANLRTGKLTVGGQTLTLNEEGRANVASAASFSTTIGFAAESIGSLFGAGMANGTSTATTQPLPTNLGGTTVSVIDAKSTSRLAPLFFTSSGQVNFLVPTGTAAGPARSVVRVSGAPVSDARLTITPISPGLFSLNATGSGLAAALVLRVKADNSQAFEPVAQFDQAQNKYVPVPIDLGPATDRVFLVLYGTGIRGRSALGAVSVKAGDATAPVSFAGAAAGFTGLDQINAELPKTLAGKGEVTILLTADGKTTNAVTVNIK